MHIVRNQLARGGCAADPRTTSPCVHDSRAANQVRLLGCASYIVVNNRVRCSLRDRMERGTPKTQYSPRNPTSSARLIMHKVEAAAQTASQLDDLELTDHQSLL